MFEKRLERLRQRHQELKLPWEGAARYLDLVLFQAQVHPAKIAYRFRPQDAKPIEWTFETLIAQATAWGSRLRAAGARPGERIALIVDTSPELIGLYLGAMHAGCVPLCLPLPPSGRLRSESDYPERIRAILDDCQVAFLIAERPHLESLDGKLGGAAARSSFPRSVFTPEKLATGFAAAPPVAMHPARRGDPALIQYTSGSLQAPRGVVITHENLIRFSRAEGQAAWMSDEEVVLSWLPFNHDLGLIAIHLTTLAHGAEHTLIRPSEFLARPLLWLELSTRWKATMSGGPAFAFRLCTKAARNGIPHPIDLSTWSRVPCAGERIPPDVFRDFRDTFAPYGFDPRAFYPCYGLAEHVVGVAQSRPGAYPRIDRVRRQALESGARAVPAPDSPDAIEIMSVGPPISPARVEIRDARGAALPERGIGEIVAISDFCMRGYFKDVQAGAAQPREIRTGDLGYLADGEVFVVGRLKELIIRRGVNIAPQDIEDACARTPDIPLGPVIATGVPSDETGTEDIVVLAELRGETAPGRAADPAAIADRLREHVLARTGHSIFRIVLVRPGELPRTTSGKLRRVEARARLLAGAYGAVRES